MNAAEGLEQLFAAHSAVPALAVLQQLRKDLSQQQAQMLLKNHRHCLQMGTCSFGRRGRAAYALRTGTEVQRLFDIANISDEDAAQFWATGVGQRLRECDRPTPGAPNCAVVPLDTHATCLDCVHHALIAAGATDVPAPDILLATVVGAIAIAESWVSMCFQVLHAHASSLSSTCTAAQYGEALQQHRLLPGNVELAVLAHALNIVLTVFDPAGLQICYWGSSTTPTEVCLIRQTGLAGTPVSYRLLNMVPAVTDAEQHIPGYFGASWCSGPGHSLGISVQLAAWSRTTLRHPSDSARLFDASSLYDAATCINASLCRLLFHTFSCFLFFGSKTEVPFADGNQPACHFADTCSTVANSHNMPPKMAHQSQPATSSAGAAAKPPVNIADLWVQLAAVSPTGGGCDRSSLAGVPKRPLIFKQQLLLGSMGCHDEDVLHTPHTNTEFNVLLAEGRKYKDEFQVQHDAKPASTFLYNMMVEIHEGDMPDQTVATHTAVMQLWIAAAGSLRADTAIELIYDYGMDAGTVLKADQAFACSVLTTAQQARASGALLATTTPAKRAATSPAEPHTSAPACTRMKDDTSCYQPFRDHFTLTSLMSTANPALAQKMEAFYIRHFKAQDRAATMCCTGRLLPAQHSTNTPTAITVQDDDAPATLA
ncbi:hypothetical protein VOLCADRAFT_104684 [Volvox carteri f. nagariensis]|uniref:Uncharacterized protein n=1 Tax=Volvox carteri f. nagariensis TaxID=3068 RepID=D8TV28_VOLCA|nr:uncharacterized protein VOLCADRAFT_104684 [Volvox carteri f. nagariensis]EFJ48505.1 hypothetical protein VOLCADRAFT_104684 [Volvox carteri f. nagariensis]|eukprot:XP_002950304.1 hypothetical protein VOLCADRAFT_104684 [Volvox carteri f. nagariensis]